MRAKPRRHGALPAGVEIDGRNLLPLALLPLFALPMAAVFDRLRHTSTSIRAVGAGAIGAAVVLSTFQMLQYWNSLIPFQNTTWSDYSRIFLQWP